jgi:hypothetical protein
LKNAIFDQKFFKRFFSSEFFLFFVTKTLNPESEPDPDSHEMPNPDPQEHWFPESDVPLRYLPVPRML